MAGAVSETMPRAFTCSLPSNSAGGLFAPRVPFARVHADAWSQLARVTFFV